MSNVPRQNPYRSHDLPGKTLVSRKDADGSTPDATASLQYKTKSPSWAANPDSNGSINSAKSANPSMPWAEPEIDEVSPYGPGDRQISDDG